MSGTFRKQLCTLSMVSCQDQWKSFRPILIYRGWKVPLPM